MASRLVFLLLLATVSAWCEQPARTDEPAGQFELYTGRRSRQTVSDYKSGRFNRPGVTRRTIVITPYGEWSHPEDEPGLTAFLEAFFQLPVRWETPRALPPGGGKTSADRIQRELRRTLSTDAVSQIALTQVDLYAEDVGPGRLLFGQGHYFNRTAVASMDRLDSPQASLRRHRLYKLTAHELLHTFNLRHCRRYRCILNSSSSVAESDRRPLHLCPECLEKLHHAIGFDPERRYRQLLEATRPALPADSAWFARRLSYLGH
ncbi:MAG: hypothetical protein KC910_17930 [Candidatus Eremiobacteraeota bacterium]|nr:hypothetical protein [Candidatus Eremiobacteraeota bacterium]